MSDLEQVLNDYIEHGNSLPPIDPDSTIECAICGWSYERPSRWWLDPVTENGNGGFDLWKPVACWDREQDGPMPRPTRLFGPEAFGVKL